MPPKRKKRKDGRYMEQIKIGYQDSGKIKYKSIYGRTLAELEMRVTEFKSNFFKGIIIDDKNLTVKEWGNQWIALYKSGKEVDTYSMYEYTLKNHIYPSLGFAKIKDIKTHHIQELLNQKHQEGLTRTLELIVLTLNQMFKKAIRAKLIYENPCEDVEMPSLPKRAKRALTIQEMEYILEANLSLKQRAYLYTLLFSGVRRGESLALERINVDLKEQFVSVKNTLKETKAKGVYIKPYPKSTSGFRTLRIPKILSNILEEYTSSVNSVYLFPAAKTNTPMTKSSFIKFWNGIIKELQLVVDKLNEERDEFNKLTLSKDITPHLFRHTYATLLYYSKMDIKLAQYRLDHSSIQMTLDIYTHLDTANDGVSLYKYMVKKLGNIDFEYQVNSHKSVSDKKFKIIRKQKPPET